MIEFRQVSRSYGDKLAVDNLSLSVAAGELYSLLGHNGAGKTTAIKMLVGLMRPATGSIHVGGFDVVAETRRAVALIGYVPDQPFLYDKLSGREVLQFVGRMYGLSQQETVQAIDREVERFELAEFLDELTEAYSHGMKQRTVFASALLHRPRVLVVDEPMVGLDPHSIRLVKDLLQREVADGMCVLMSTHTLPAAEEISHRVGIMNHGRLVFDGTVSEMRERFAGGQQTLEAMYLAITAESNGAVQVPNSTSASEPMQAEMTPSPALPPRGREI
jgi:ABC-2 type transport system ATP-binding protein